MRGFVVVLLGFIGGIVFTGLRFDYPFLRMGIAVALCFAALLIDKQGRDKRLSEE